MPTPVEFTYADLDAELQKLNPDYSNMVDFIDRRTRAVKRAFAELEQDSVNDLGHTLLEVTPPTIGATPAISTEIADVYNVPLIADAKQVHGDTIWIAEGTDNFMEVPRMTLDEITLGTTPIAFYETKGNIVVVIKEAEVPASADLHYNYVRKLDCDQDPTSNVIDIDPVKFETFLASVNSFML